MYADEFTIAYIPLADDEIKGLEMVKRHAIHYQPLFEKEIKFN